ncbi:MAG: RimJ/RimL family protein N-acetyltransferase [Myxococcota bacterium]
MSRPVELPWFGVDATGEPLTLRFGVRRDATRYLEHLEQLVGETPFMLQGPEDPLPTVAEQRDVIVEYTQRANCVCIVAVRPGRPPGRQTILGSVTLAGGRSRCLAHTAELAMGVIHSEWRKGLGSLLLDAALTWAEEAPTLVRVSLQVYATNVAAKTLYEQRGFVQEGVLHGYAKWAGQYDDLVGMSIPVRHG